MRPPIPSDAIALPAAIVDDDRMSDHTSSLPSTPRFRLPFYYGWLLVTVSFVTMAVGVNARTAFSLLYPPILAEFGWDRGVTAGVFSFGFLLSALITPFVGRLIDRRGPRIGVEVGIAVMGAGLLLATLAHEPWQLYLTLGAMCGGGVNCFTYTTQSTYLPNWFVRRRGLAISIAFSGVGIGSITILPWLQTLIASGGWRQACWMLGLLVLVLLGPLNLLLRHRPQDIGLEPDGRRAAGSARRMLRTSSTRPGQRSIGRCAGRCTRGASGGWRSAISAASLPGTRCRCTRPNTSPKSASRRPTQPGRSAL
jgi:MFS family permease